MKYSFLFLFTLVWSSVHGTPTRDTANKSGLDSLLTAFVQEDNQKGYKALLENTIRFNFSDTTDPVFRGLYLMAYDRNAEAEVAFSDAIKDELGEPAVRGKLFYLRSQCKAMLGDLKASLEDLDSVVALTPIWPEAWSNRSNLLTTLGYAKEGLESCDRALALNGKYCRAWNNRGFALSRLGRRDEASASFDSALAYCPDLVDALFNKSLDCFDRQDWKGADSMLDIILKANPRSGHALCLKARSCFSTTLSPALAFPYVDSAIAIGYKNKDSWTLHAMLLADLYRYSDSKASFDSALALDPDNYWLKGMKARSAKHLVDSAR